MRDPEDKKSYKQVARRYAEAEILRVRRAALDAKAEAKRLREALEQIAEADGAGSDELRAIARRALSEGITTSEDDDDG